MGLLILKQLDWLPQFRLPFFVVSDNKMYGCYVLLDGHDSDWTVDDNGWCAYFVLFILTALEKAWAFDDPVYVVPKGSDALAQLVGDRLQDILRRSLSMCDASGLN